MSFKNTTKSLFAALVLSTAAIAASPALADEVTTFVTNDAAIGGTDPVAYFTEGKAVAGKDSFTTTYDDVTWKFSSAENRDLFAANPEKYAPQYGGFCAFGLSKGFKVPVVPEAWKIIDGKLYLNNSLSVQSRFEKDTSRLINDADLNWEIVKTKKPSELTEPIIR